ncbi:MAG TPA: DUF1501 domain-containing protein [Chloroflexota bacterium]
MTEDGSMDGVPVQGQRCCDEYDDYRRSQWSLRQNRRDFLKTAVGAMAAAPLLPHLLLNSKMAERASASTDPILVVIQLEGGNDGLNTIVPFGSSAYYQDRPNIAVPQKSVLPIDSMVGFNPNLKGLKPLFDQGKVAIVQGVGYDNPSRSHFQGTAIWETADPNGTSTTGWLGRYLDATLTDKPNPLAAIALGPLMPQTLITQKAPVTAIESVDSFRFQVARAVASPILDAYGHMYGSAPEKLPASIGLVRSAGADAQQGVQDLQSLATNYRSTVQYPVNALARELQLVAQMISANLGTRVFHVSLNGFDDHVAEVFTHANLLKYLGDSLAAFYADLQAMGKSDQVVSLTFSEFGRRVRENAGRGTDHGTAAPMFIVGGKVKGGLYGDDPILSNLDDNGDLKYGVDFRSVYGTIIDGWLGGSSKAILGGSYERLPFL